MKIYITQSELDMLGVDSKVYWSDNGIKKRGIVYDTCFENGEVELLTPNGKVWVSLSEILGVLS
jgi:hypothetical protein